MKDYIIDRDGRREDVDSGFAKLSSEAGVVKVLSMYARMTPCFGIHPEYGESFHVPHDGRLRIVRASRVKGQRGGLKVGEQADVYAQDLFDLDLEIREQYELVRWFDQSPVEVTAGEIDPFRYGRFLAEKEYRKSVAASDDVEFQEQLKTIGAYPGTIERRRVATRCFTASYEGRCELVRGLTYVACGRLQDSPGLCEDTYTLINGIGGHATLHEIENVHDGLVTYSLPGAAYGRKWTKKEQREFVGVRFAMEDVGTQHIKSVKTESGSYLSGSNVVLLGAE